MSLFSKKDIHIIDGPILPNMLRYALPIMLTNILQLFYNSADMFVIGNFCSDKNALGSVGCTGALINMILGVFIGLGAGVAVTLAPSLGAGNKENPQDFAVSDIYKTDVCPLAKIMRRELRKRGVKKLKTVFSKEEPMTPIFQASDGKRHTPASNAFTPSVMGLIIGGEVIKDLIRN